MVAAHNACLLQFRAVITFDSDTQQYVCTCVDTELSEAASTEQEAIAALLEILERRLTAAINLKSWHLMPAAAQFRLYKAWIRAASSRGTTTFPLKPELSSEVVVAGTSPARLTH